MSPPIVPKSNKSPSPQTYQINIGSGFQSTSLIEDNPTRDNSRSYQGVYLDTGISQALWFHPQHSILLGGNLKWAQLWNPEDSEDQLNTLDIQASIGWKFKLAQETFLTTQTKIGPKIFYTPSLTAPEGVPIPVENKIAWGIGIGASLQLGPLLLNGTYQRGLGAQFIPDQEFTLALPYSSNEFTAGISLDLLSLYRYANIQFPQSDFKNFFGRTELSAYASGSFYYNPNNSETNQLKVYKNTNGPRFDVAGASLNISADRQHPIGFETTFEVGKNVAAIGANTLGNGEWNLLGIALKTYLPFDEETGLALKCGRFGTDLGVGNPHSLSFHNFGPYNHLGCRGEYAPIESLSFFMILSNGLDVGTVAKPEGFSGTLGSSYQPKEDMTLTLNTSVTRTGPEIKTINEAKIDIKKIADRGTFNGQVGWGHTEDLETGEANNWGAVHTTTEFSLAPQIALRGLAEIFIFPYSDNSNDPNAVMALGLELPFTPMEWIDEDTRKYFPGLILTPSIEWDHDLTGHTPFLEKNGEEETPTQNQVILGLQIRGEY